MSNSTKIIIVATNFMITCPLDHPMGHVHCLNPMRYHSVYIGNTCCHQPPSIVTQFIGIYDPFRVLPKDQSFMLILVQTQYPLKV